MNFKNSLSFAQDLDGIDPMKSFRSEFLFPSHNSKPFIYMCGNSLGLQPKSARDFIQLQLEQWHNLAVEGWFEGQTPWMSYHKKLKPLMAKIVGAQDNEVSPMNTLTVNLHLLMVSFYRPDKQRFKIIMEADAFPSDQYAVESQVRFHGYHPEEAIVEVSPRPGEYTLREEDIQSVIERHGAQTSLVLFGGVNYLTGQCYDMEAITNWAHKAGALAGFDLAHAAGNVPLNLHKWGVDFACWCSYKYQNSGPGGIGGIYIHEQHFDYDVNRFAGWWGYQEERRFKMEKDFRAEIGADGWQVSCTQVIPLALYHSSLEIFKRAGFMSTLRQKSEQLSAYLFFLLSEINRELGKERYQIITPIDPAKRGAQVSIIAKERPKDVFKELMSRNILGDWREPNVIRFSPVPLYNSFEDVFLVAQTLMTISKELF